MKLYANQTRPTELYPRAWIAHHRLQYGRNYRYVAHRYEQQKGR